MRSRLSIATASVDFAAATGSAVANSSVPASVATATTSAAGGATSSVASNANTALSSGYHTSSSRAAATAVSAVSGATQALKSKYYTAKDLTVWGMTLKVMREEGGVKGLYRGLVATAFGVAPYVGINFAAYEALRGVITPPGKTNVGRKLTCGALAGGCERLIVEGLLFLLDRWLGSLSVRESGKADRVVSIFAGSISQTLTYPFDVLRRKMQVTGMQGGQKYSGALDALRSVLRSEGVAGLYRGLWPNLRKCVGEDPDRSVTDCCLTDSVKVAPSIATSFFTYELVSIMFLERKR